MIVIIALSAMNFYQVLKKIVNSKLSINVIEKFFRKVTKVQQVFIFLGKIRQSILFTQFII